MSGVVDGYSQAALAHGFQRGQQRFLLVNGHPFSQFQNDPVNGQTGSFQQAGQSGVHACVW